MYKKITFFLLFFSFLLTGKFGFVYSGSFFLMKPNSSATPVLCGVLASARPGPGARRGGKRRGSQARVAGQARVRRTQGNQSQNRARPSVRHRRVRSPEKRNRGCVLEPKCVLRKWLEPKATDWCEYIRRPFGPEPV